MIWYIKSEAFKVVISKLFSRIQEELSKHPGFEKEVEKVKKLLFDNIDMHQIRI